MCSPALIGAAYGGYMSAVKTLLDFDANVNQMDFVSTALIHLECESTMYLLLVFFIR